MFESPRLVYLGQSGSTPIYGDVTYIAGDQHQTVTLLAPYARVCPPGMPSPPSLTGSEVKDCPQTFPAGAVFTFFQFEASALISAGGAA